MIKYNVNYNMDYAILTTIWTIIWTIPYTTFHQSFATQCHIRFAVDSAGPLSHEGVVKKAPVASVALALVAGGWECGECRYNNVINPFGNGEHTNYL